MGARDTMWANQYLACGTGGYLEAVAARTPSPDAYATRTHPLGDPPSAHRSAALYAYSVDTTGIEGMDGDEAGALLARLTAHATHLGLHANSVENPGGQSIPVDSQMH